METGWQEQNECDNEDQDLSIRPKRFVENDKYRRYIVDNIERPKGTTEVIAKQITNHFFRVNFLKREVPKGLCLVPDYYILKSVMVEVLDRNGILDIQEDVMD